MTLEELLTELELFAAALVKVSVGWSALIQATTGGGFTVSVICTFLERVPRLNIIDPLYVPAKSPALDGSIRTSLKELLSSPPPDGSMLIPGVN